MVCSIFSVSASQDLMNEKLPESAIGLNPRPLNFHVQTGGGRGLTTAGTAVIEGGGGAVRVLQFP